MQAFIPDESPPLVRIASFLDCLDAFLAIFTSGLDALFIYGCDARASARIPSIISEDGLNVKH